MNTHLINLLKIIQIKVVLVLTFFVLFSKYHLAHYTFPSANLLNTFLQFSHLRSESKKSLIQVLITLIARNDMQTQIGEKSNYLLFLFKTLIFQFQLQTIQRKLLEYN